MIHLGKNPKKGGNPPKDNKGKENINLKLLFLLKKENIWFKLKILKFFNEKIIQKIKKEYNKK